MENFLQPPTPPLCPIPPSRTFKESIEVAVKEMQTNATNAQLYIIIPSLELTYNNFNFLVLICSPMHFIGAEQHCQGEISLQPVQAKKSRLQRSKLWYVMLFTYDQLCKYLKILLLYIKPCVICKFLNIICMCTILYVN